jgi:hypothetical protein
MTLIDQIKAKVKELRDDYHLVDKITGQCFRGKFRAKFQMFHEYTGQRSVRIFYFTWD